MLTMVYSACMFHTYIVAREPLYHDNNYNLFELCKIKDSKYIICNMLCYNF